MTDPFTSTFDAMDRLVGQLASGARATAASAASGGMPLDLFRAGDHYVLTMDRAGVEPGRFAGAVERRGGRWGPRSGGAGHAPQRQSHAA